jgi:capsular exopolysaccharide synthesis family protein
MTTKSYPIEDTLEDEGVEFKLDWPAIIQGIIESWWICLLVAAVVTLITVKIVYQWPDYFTATAKMRVIFVSRSPGQIQQELISGTFDASSYYATQVQLIKREELLKKTAEDLHLDGYFGTSIDGAANILTNVLNVNVIPGTQIMAVSATVRTSDMAAKIANNICENYIRLSAIDRLRVPQEIVKLFKDLDSASYAKVVASSKEVSSFYSDVLEEKIARLPTVMQDATLNKLEADIRALDQEKAMYADRYTPEHPVMKKLDVRIDFLKQEQKQQKERILSALRSSIMGEFSAENSEIVELARPGGPSGPERNKRVVSNGLGSLFGMLLLIGLLTVFNRRVTREEDFKFLSGLPFFGYIPELPEFRMLGNSRSVKKNVFNEFRKNTVLSDHVHEVCSNILFSLPGNKNKVILLSGILPEDGKTLVSCLSALSLASMGGKVLLVDIDVRAPSVHLKFDLDNEQGLTDVLTGHIKWQDAVKKVEGVPALHVLTSGASTRNAPALLMSEDFQRFIYEVRDKYDRIVLDAPPALFIPDAFIIGKFADGVVLIFRSGRVVISDAKKLYSRMLHANLPVIGGCINRANIQRLNMFKNYMNTYAKYYHK